MAGAMLVDTKLATITSQSNYWSSTEYNTNNAWNLYSGGLNNNNNNNNKNNSNGVRPVLAYWIIA